MAEQTTTTKRVFRGRFTSPVWAALTLAVALAQPLPLVLWWGELHVFMRAHLFFQALFFAAASWLLWSRKDWGTTLGPDSVTIIDQDGTRLIQRQEIDRLESVPGPMVRVVLTDGTPAHLPAVQARDRAELRSWLASP